MRWCRHSFHILLFISLYQDVIIGPLLLLVSASDPPKTTSKSDTSSHPLYHNATNVIPVLKLPDQQDCPWACILYVPWCVHCIAFEPVYRDWSSQVVTDPYGTTAYSMECGGAKASLCSELPILGYPTLLYYNGYSASLEYHTGSITELTDRLYNGLHPQGRVAEKTSMQQHCTAQRTGLLKQRSDDVLVADKRGKKLDLTIPSSTPMWRFNAYLSFHFALENEVPQSVRKNVEAYRALRDVLRSDPSRPERLSDLNAVETTLLHFLDHAISAMPSLLFPHGPPGDPGCSYTCGLWKLFHVMMHGPRPRDALLSIRGYVGTFFQCLDCRHHFLQLAQYVETEVRESEDLSAAALWLWHAHNVVNMRLGKNLFPGVDECPSCRTREEVANHLREVYRAADSLQNPNLSTFSETLGTSLFSWIHISISLFALFSVFFLFFIVYARSLLQKDLDLDSDERNNRTDKIAFRHDGEKESLRIIDTV